ncbi:hypothetical protein RB653_002804 [Dictyostelium firmibasis]|uniref:Uncharacterized protein n=1 Tax=Dictyostelium firmibasis TaxID=79012 RepID=A0AAN7TY11_9MYCE
MTSIKQLESVIYEINKINKSLLDDLLALKEDKKLTNIQLNAALTSKEKSDTKYEKAKKDLDIFKKRSEDFEAKLSEIEIEYKKKVEENDSLNQDNKEIKLKNEKNENEINRINEENERLQNVIESNKSVLLNVEEKDKIIEQLTNQNKEIKIKLDILENDKSKFDNIKSIESKKRIEAEQYSIGLERRASELEEKLNQYEQQLTSLKQIEKQYKQLQEHNQQSTQQQQTSYSKLEQDLKDYKQMFENEQQSREKIELEAIDIKSHQSKLTDQLNLEKQEQLELKNQYQQEKLILKQTIDSIQNDYQSEKQKREQLELDLNKKLELQLENQSKIHQLSDQIEKNQFQTLYQSLLLLNNNSINNNNNNNSNNSNSNNNNNNGNNNNEDNSDISSSNSSITNTPPTSDHTNIDIQNNIILEHENKLKDYVEDIILKTQKNSELLEKIEQEKKKLQLEKETFEKEKLNNTTNANNNSNGHNISSSNKQNEEFNLVKSALDAKIDDLLKQLEVERKNRLKLEEQLQQHNNHHHQPSMSLNNYGLSPAKFSSFFKSSNKHEPTVTTNNNNNSNNSSPPSSTNLQSPESNETQPNILSSPISISENSNTTTTTTVENNQTMISDTERKDKLFQLYQSLLVECNTLLYSKQDQVSDLEKGGFIKKFQVSTIKSSITRIEPIQDKIKKELKIIDSKLSITISEENDKKALYKILKQDLDGEI